jgi:transposase
VFAPVDREWLKERLSEGRSIESIAREVGKGASTVAYWVNKYGFVSQHAMRHASRGGVDEANLRELVERGLSIRQIAAELELSAATVRHWLTRYGLATDPLNYAKPSGEKPDAVLRECEVHGWTEYRPVGARGNYRCTRCLIESVSDRRRRVKALLVDEAGGACRLCGYAKYAGALQFHHLDPASKRFSLSLRGVTRAISVLREEARKCVLLCANCHAEVEAGVAAVPATRAVSRPALPKALGG